MAALVFWTCGAHGQASFQLSNRGGLYGGSRAPIFDGNGVPLAGPNYLAELWGGTTPDSLVPALDYGNHAQRTLAVFNTDGFFFAAGTVCQHSHGATYSYAWLQVRAWDARLGGTYEEVMALGIGGYGESPLFYQQGSNPLRIPPELPAPLIGLLSFSLRPVVPEPGTWVLLTLGGLGFLIAARRNQ